MVLGAPGEYVLVQSDSGGRTRALLKGSQGFPPIPTLAGPAARGSQYLLVYPATMIGCDVDSMWFKQMLPEAPDRVRNVVAVCFPRETAARPDFEAVAAQYYRRFETAIAEDNEISERQFAGLSSPLARPGRFSHREPLVHAIDNWILDQVLDAWERTRLSPARVRPPGTDFPANGIFVPNRGALVTAPVAIGPVRQRGRDFEQNFS